MSPDNQQPSAPDMSRAEVSVSAPARLHLGFIDMHGGLGRVFGSLGVSLAEIRTHVTATHSDDVIIHGPSSNRASACVGRLLEYLDIRGGVNIRIHEAIPEHAGLGSGTQLSLAVGTAIARLYEKKITPRELGRIMDRGARSGIGVGAFSMGGFLVDGGRGDNTEVPPIISHLYFPESWRFLLVFDNALQGVSGIPEREAFKSLPPMQESSTEYLCRLLLMQALPALAEEDCDQFGGAVTEIQRQVGDHFAAAQGGRYCSDLVAEVLPWLTQHGATGVGQSSWGPTGFGLFANETEAYQSLKLLREYWQDDERLSFRVCSARNRKADISINHDLPGKDYQFGVSGDHSRSS